MDYNYHTHTKRCGHATGEIEEYIKIAIEGGVKYFGFSDHAPLKFSDGTQSEYRVRVEEARAYVSEINELKEKYKEQIDIKVGFEMEYYEELSDEMLKNVKEYGAEYLILGEHFIKPENIPNSLHVVMDKINDEKYLKEYSKRVVSAIETGVFTYVAHPDAINFFGDEELYKKEMRKICVASREKRIPLEINFLGIRGNRNYPNELFWEIAGQEQAPTVFGFDAHRAEDAYDDKSLEKANELVERYGLNYIGKPKIRLIKEL